MSLKLVILSGLLSFLGGLVALIPLKEDKHAETASAIITIFASLSGLAAALVLFFVDSAPTRLVWPFFSRFEAVIGLDYLSALFLIPLSVVSGVCSLYGLEYWPIQAHKHGSKALRLFFGAAVAGMTLVLSAQSAVIFLFGWEIMALSAFFLVSAESGHSDARRAAWIYLVAAHLGALILMGLFSYLHALCGTLEFFKLAGCQFDSQEVVIIFIFALVGFGLKSGVMPFHFWLPAAHASAPSHVSALMSGVLIKMGLYGFIRMLSLLPALPIWAGVTLLILGLCSAILGILGAINQQDIKRMLAYSSIENVGLIYTGLGLGIIGQSLGNFGIAALGYLGAIFHLLNHSFFKALLFLSAGEVIHITHVRRFDRLGGLAQKAPFLSYMYLIGTLAISGLPPLNGFFSEFLLYAGALKLSLVKAAAVSSLGILTFAILILTGGLALFSFVRAYGCVFLGTPRSDYNGESPLNFPIIHKCLGVLGVICFLFGTFAVFSISFLEHTFKNIFAGDSIRLEAGLGTLLPLQQATWILSFVVLITAALTAWRARRLLPAGTAAATVTWDCGLFPAPNSKVQYTSASFVQMLLKYFSWGPRNIFQLTPISAYFPDHSHIKLIPREVLLNDLMLPFTHRTGRIFLKIRFMQQGKVQIYLLYIIAALMSSLMLCLLFKGGAGG